MQVAPVSSHGRWVPYCRRDSFIQLPETNLARVNKTCPVIQTKYLPILPVITFNLIHIFLT